MYTLGIPNRQYRRATQVLGSTNSNPIEYDSIDQGDGFYLFSFPEADEYDFRDITKLLKNNGITTIGADDQLSERKIMKLTDLLNEQYDDPYPDGNEGNPEEHPIITKLKETLELWRKPTYQGGIDTCERSNQYDIDIQNIVEEFTDPDFAPGDRSGQMSDDEADELMTKGDYLQEQKLRKLIRKMIKE